uniref:Uncharacterized protein n=1 Tax=Salix viminalis TaxID=40686 RepID=A0A6N2NJB4_SALVM
MMVEFVEDSGAPREDFYINVKEELQKARGCYDESITKEFSDEEFSKMMFIDGCFILQFMHCLINYGSEKLEMSDRQIFHVKRDLLLLENQLPFAVLHSLRKQRYKNDKAGILFRPKWTAGAITDVKFKSLVLSGKVEIPPIIIDESTESLLLNLVAYESSAALRQLWVRSYILFMDSLIDDDEDVEEMRSNGIIINYLGADRKVAYLFNGMGRSLTHDTYDTAAYNDVKMTINKQCESTHEKKTYSRERNLPGTDANPQRTSPINYHSIEYKKQSTYEG